MRELRTEGSVGMMVGFTCSWQISRTDMLATVFLSKGIDLAPEISLTLSGGIGESS